MGGPSRRRLSRILPLALCASAAACSSSRPSATPVPPAPPLTGQVSASISNWRLTGRVDSKNQCDRTDAPRVISSRQARYPEDVIRKKVEGIVTLQATVAAAGVPEELKVRSSMPDLSGLALETFREWRFKPALCDGKPVDSYVTASFSFRIAR